MTRTRSCNSPVPAMGGKDCSQFGAPVEVMKCNEQQCPSKRVLTSNENVVCISN